MQQKSMTFNEDAALYDKMRPGYPEAIFHDLQNLAKLNKQSTILEVGCGTGQATRNLVDISRNITCLDPGASLLAVAEEKFPQLKFENTTFEAFETKDLYDLIISATAWHWIDPNVGYEKAHRLLKNEGYLAILHTYHIETDPSAFHNRAQFIYSQYSSKPPQDLASRQPIEDTARALENEYFQLTHQVERKWQHTYTVEEYLALRNTYSGHRSMTEQDREQFEAKISDFANKEFDGKIAKHYTTVLFLAKRS